MIALRQILDDADTPPACTPAPMIPMPPVLPPWSRDPLALAVEMMLYWRGRCLAAEARLPLSAANFRLRARARAALASARGH